MSSRAPVHVPNEDIPAHAERLLVDGDVSRAALATAFEPTSAASAEVLVEGEAFYPRMLADVAAATSSVHVNQFGFRPGVVGDEFAETLVAKAEAGIRVRLVVDRQGSDPERGSRDFYDRLTAAGIEICVVRATRPRVPAGVLGGGGATRWNLRGLGHIDHRKVAVVDGRIGWVGGAGIEDHFQDGRFHDLFLRVTGPVVAQLQLVFLGGFRWLERRMRTESYAHFSVRFLPGRTPAEAEVIAIVAQHGFAAAELSHWYRNGEGMEYRMVVHTRDHAAVLRLSESLREREDIAEFKLSPAGY